MSKSIFIKLIALVVLAIYLINVSWLRSPPDGKYQLLAHRGVHQTYSIKNLNNDSCTATRIYAPDHRYLENTLESIAYAFKYGADIVEFDIHPTTDGKFAVFHDWTIDCRTNGTGVTREHSFAYLKTLDIAWGYTYDGGKTFPLRGTGIGKMPSMTEVFKSFPGKRFMINIKSNDPNEGDKLAEYFFQHPEIDTSKLIVYGGHLPTSKVIELVPSLRGYSRNSIKACLTKYALAGAFGYIPKSCRNTILAVPLNYTKYFWGWPIAFMQRMEDVGTEVILTGNHNRATEGIDDRKTLTELTQDFRGIIWTNKIEVVGK